jgi:hypothetical protein
MTAMDTPHGARGSFALRPVLVATCLALGLAALWLLTHHYRGLSQDGELYALQALARLRPNLANDIYLAYGSQDRFTVFSPLYAELIGMLGLQTAARVLFVICTVWFFAAAWAVARALWGSATAWLAAAALIVCVCFYGGYGIFHYAEFYLSARSLGEALVVTALALHFLGRPRFALAVAIAALAIHPLMVLPGLLLIIHLRLGPRRSLALAAVALAAVLALALAAAQIHARSGLLTIIDGTWLEVVKQRSQFLFLGYWKWTDWQMHARVFFCLTLGVLALDGRARDLCLGAMLVGAAGLAVAWIAGSIGPLALLLQGQAWRWFWISGFVSVLVLVPTAARLWREHGIGMLCAVLLIASWTFAPLPVLPALAVALILWLLRGHASTLRWLPYAAYALIAIIAAWSLANLWMLFTTPRAQINPEPLWVDRMRGVFNLEVCAIVIFWVLWRWMMSVRSTWPALLACAVMLAFLPRALPESLYRVDPSGSPAQASQFADWRAAIPPADNVLIVPMRKAAGFIWFTLDRPSYLSVDQSAGVVFSRATALEVERRARVLLPIGAPDYEILNLIERDGKGRKPDESSRALTRENLSAICSDPALGFVIARESLGFSALRHVHAGDFKDWNLYDCRRLRAGGPAA